MKSKILSKQELIVIACTILVLFLAIIFYQVWENSTQKDSSTLVKNTTIIQPKNKNVSFGLPMRLRIPSININANIEQVGVTSQGTMDIPKGPDDVAWFNFGPRPGESGSSVLAGHYGWKNGTAAVFDNLHKLHKGDKLYLEDKNGVIITFIVKKNKKYNAKGDASDVFSSSDGGAHLNLVTCDGAWDNVKHSRPYRLVVFADKQ